LHSVGLDDEFDPERLQVDLSPLRGRWAAKQKSRYNGGHASLRIGRGCSPESEVSRHLAIPQRRQIEMIRNLPGGLV
jgi:hypothetical protein